MIEQDSVFIEKRRSFYEDHYRGAEPIDAWHAHAQTVVHAITRKWFYELKNATEVRVLNAGSGGSDYGIKIPMVHLDLTPKRVAHFPKFLVADVSEIPVAASSFDIVLCVGSVLNYCDPVQGIRELHRVLRPGGFLVLEYERSGSPEYWSKHGFSAACVRVDTFYGRVRTELWAYGDQFVDGLLGLQGFRTLKETRFHGFSSLVLALTGSATIAARFVFGDTFLTNVWPLRVLASNRMLAVEKLAHQ